MRRARDRTGCVRFARGGDACGVIAEGSSPLTRGKHVLVGVDAPHLGLIPAHAGKTRLAASSWTARRAHPRSRGENLDNPDGLPEWTGSSPLTRGKPSMTWAGDTVNGLIPAHAGKT